MSEGRVRRSWFLVFVVFLANAFLVIFGAEAIVSIVNGLAFKGFGPAALTGLRDMLAALTLLLWFMMVLALIFVPHLPKSVLLPPVLVLLWQAIGAPPLKWSMFDPATWLPIDAIGLASVMLAFVGSKISTDSWFLSAANLPHKENLLRRTLIALPLSLIVIVVGFAGALAFGIKTFAEQSTDGYLRLTATGIEVQEAVFRKGDRTVHLVGVVHFAEPQFYRDLYASIPAEAVILAEGVTDREGKAKGGLSYDNVARTIGLESQSVFEELLGPPEPVPSATAQPLAAARTKPAVIRADIDISELSPVTLRFLERVGSVYASKNFDDVLQKLDSVGREFTDADIKAVMDDILEKRNARVLAELDKQLPSYKVAFIPWGAQHMPGLEKGLVERGFKAEAKRLRPLARYQTIIDAVGKMARPRGVEPLLQD